MIFYETATIFNIPLLQRKSLFFYNNFNSTALYIVVICAK